MKDHRGSPRGAAASRPRPRGAHPVADGPAADGGDRHAARLDPSPGARGGGVFLDPDAGAVSLRGARLPADDRPRLARPAGARPVPLRRRPARRRSGAPLRRRPDHRRRGQPVHHPLLSDHHRGRHPLLPGREPDRGGGERRALRRRRGRAADTPGGGIHRPRRVDARDEPVGGRLPAPVGGLQLLSRRVSREPSRRVAAQHGREAQHHQRLARRARAAQRAHPAEHRQRAGDHRPRGADHLLQPRRGAHRAGAGGGRARGRLQRGLPDARPAGPLAGVEGARERAAAARGEDGGEGR